MKRLEFRLKGLQCSLKRAAYSAASSAVTMTYEWNPAKSTHSQHYTRTTQPWLSLWPACYSYPSNPLPVITCRTLLKPKSFC